jgi:hypothetical protein
VVDVNADGADLDDVTWRQFKVITPGSFAEELRLTWEHGLRKWSVGL